MKRSLGAGEWVRRGLGLLVLAGVAAIALGLDTGYLAKLSTAQTNVIEQNLASRLGMKDVSGGTDLVEAGGGTLDLPVEGALPPLDGITHWINSPPLTREQLRGKVVVIDFWTYSCINCLRSIPYVRAWAERYRSKGLVVVGVHAPEFAFEKDLDNVRKAVADLRITYPVAVDNNYAVWRAFDNRYWPAHYFIDGQGRVRFHHFGEGKYDVSERVIRQLLTEAGADLSDIPMRGVALKGVEVGAALQALKSPETYIGYGRAANFVSPGGLVKDQGRLYAPAPTALNQWSLSGNWTARREHALLNQAGGRIRYRFHARDLHLVLGSGTGKPVRFRITIDGRAPGADAGIDVDEAGNGIVTGQRLYQLVRQKGAIGDRLFEIEFLDAGVQAFAFTFG